MIEIWEQPLDIEKITKLVYDEGCGAVAVFVGNVRNNTQGRNVVRLEFEAYEKMALSEMRIILDYATKKWNIVNAAVVHRVGTLRIGETAVVIAVATPHRKAAFEACQYIIDTLKKTVPIWKKEIFEDGEVWVSAHP